MAASPAYVGSCKIGANVIQLMQTADLAMVAKQLDTTPLGGSGWETFIMGTLSGKLALKGSFDQTDTNGQAAVQSAFFGRTLLSSVVFSPDNLRTYTFNAWVIDYKPAAPALGKADIDFTLLPTGAITPA